MSNLPYVLFDIGGTNTRVAVSFKGEQCEQIEIFATPQDFWTGIEKIVTSAKTLLKGEIAGTAAGGVAGPLDHTKSKTVNPPNLPKWRGMPLKEELAKALGAYVYLENDAAMAGLGEAMFGAGKGKSIVAYITLGTGVNGVKVVDGFIEKNALGYEIGHQIIDFDNSKLKIASKHGELEDFVSGREITKRYNMAPLDITDPKEWDTLSKFLAVGVHNTIVYWSPEIIVLGGSVSNKVLLASLKEELTKISTIFPTLPEMKMWELEERSAIYGALHYLESAAT